MYSVDSISSPSWLLWNCNGWKCLFLPGSPLLLFTLPVAFCDLHSLFLHSWNNIHFVLPFAPNCTQPSHCLFFFVWQNVTFVIPGTELNVIVKNTSGTNECHCRVVHPVVVVYCGTLWNTPVVTLPRGRQRAVPGPWAGGRALCSQWTGWDTRGLLSTLLPKPKEKV